MCLGQVCFLHPKDYQSKLGEIAQGSAVRFVRGRVVYHYAIYLGTSLAPEGQGVPLLWHFYGPQDDMRIRVDDFRRIVQGSPIYVFHCSCSASRRSEVIEKCLDRIGEGGYNVETNNCEHIVRDILSGQRVSHQADMYQSVTNLFSSSSSSCSMRPSSFLSFPTASSPPSVCSKGSSIPLASSNLLLASSGTSMAPSSVAASGSSSSGSSPVELNPEHMAIVNPAMDVVAFRPSTGEWVKNADCTQVFTGAGAASVAQALFHCHDCGLLCCRPCKLRHHHGCTIGLSTSDRRCCGCGCIGSTSTSTSTSTSSNANDAINGPNAMVLVIIACLLIMLMQQLFKVVD